MVYVTPKNSQHSVAEDAVEQFTALSAIAFWWLYDSQFSIISWVLKKGGLISNNINFLGDPLLAQATEVWNPTHFSRRIVPQLLEGGASEAQIEALTVANPRRFFAGDAIPRG